MSAYLYPNLKSKKAYKEAIARGEKIIARENTPRDQVLVRGTTTVTFEGPHYPAPHTFYGQAQVTDGYVTKVR